MASSGLKVTSDTGAVWPARRARAPRWDVDFPEFGAESLRRLEDGKGRRLDGADGAADFDVDQIPTVWSADAVRMREEGVWTARRSTDAV